jgi:Lrp/AsnC family leucine-responsive transcriptional regulator
MPIDRTDIRLVGELQRDGRRSIVELAETVGLSHTPCARRVLKLEQSGVIQGYTAIVDPARLGLTVQAFVQVRLERHTDDNVEQFHRALGSLDEVVGCYATTGAHDFMLQVVAQDLEAFGNIVLKKLLKIQGVRDVQSSLVLDTVKRSTRLPLAHLAARERGPGGGS